MATDGQPAQPAKMRLSAWSPEVEELRVIAERLSLVASAVAASGHVKLPKLPDRPRPVTARDRVVRKRHLDRHRRLVAQLIPTDAKED